MLDNIARDQIRSEIQQIEELLAEFAPLLQRTGPDEPDAIECAALGSVLHSLLHWRGRHLPCCGKARR